MMNQQQVDARFCEIAWAYYMELVEELTDYAVRSMERMQEAYEVGGLDD